METFPWNWLKKKKSKVIFASRFEIVVFSGEWWPLIQQRMQGNNQLYHVHTGTFSWLHTFQVQRGYWHIESPKKWSIVSCSFNTFFYLFSSLSLQRIWWWRMVSNRPNNINFFYKIKINIKNWFITSHNASNLSPPCILKWLFDNDRWGIS